MTIPDFLDRYHLPPGEHECSIEEVIQRFVITDVRTKRWSNFISLLTRLCELKLVPESILINGSFVTGRPEPGDVDFAALIPPDTIRQALNTDDDHDKEGIMLFLHPDNQIHIRNFFGAHLLVADTLQSLQWWSNLFRFGENGTLRNPDPAKDPSWVSRPPEKGILKINKTDILNHIGGV